MAWRGRGVGSPRIGDSGVYGRAQGVSGLGGGGVVIGSEGEDFDAGVGVMGHCGSWMRSWLMLILVLFPCFLYSCANGHPW